MTLPHQQATELGHSVPVTKRDPPFTLVRGWQSEAPHCGSHAAYRKLSPWSPPRSRYYRVPLATVIISYDAPRITHPDSHGTWSCST